MTRADLPILLILLIAAALPGRGVAQSEVTVGVGTDRVAGEVLGFDGTFLRLGTDAGEVTLHYDPALCSGPACPDPAAHVATLGFSGTSRLGALVLPALIEGFARERGLEVRRTDSDADVFAYELADATGPVLRLPFRLTSTADGLADLLAGEADIAMAARYPDAGEAELLTAAGLGDLTARARLIALEPLLPIVPPTLPVRSLDPAQLAGLLSGEILDWAAVGAPPQAVRLHLEEGNDETIAVISRFAPDGLAPDRPVVLHAGGVAGAVADDPGGFALVAASDVGLAQAVQIRGSCGLTSRADPASMAAGDYPLSLPLLLLQPRRRLAPEAQDFLDWTASEAAQGVMRRAGVSGLTPLPMPVAEQGERFVAAILAGGTEPGASLRDLQRLARFALGKTRLSPTFRFDGEALDPVSTGQVRALMTRLASGQLAGPLWLVGFSDGQDSPRRDLEMSRERSETVRSALTRAFGGQLPASVDLRIASFGDLLPVTCGDSAIERRLNDRVELWAEVD